ncbi:MAG: hypothetical protein KI790_15000 [Cyclobacteriaceae bacterium]|nr:hypothetical protein [Cyclobacteriaceae bacterium HetDA_MAG_MS6]
MTRPTYLLTLLSFFFLIDAGSAQSLDTKFEEMMTKSETYEVYKVIRITRLNEFWGETQDSLIARNTEIGQLTSDVTELQGNLSRQQEALAQINAELQSVKAITGSISFIGIDFKKSTYHLLVWGIIIIALGILGFVFWMYQNSHLVTRNAQKELQGVSSEFEKFRDKAREKEIKLKRELQTALNELEDLRKGKYTS